MPRIKEGFKGERAIVLPDFLIEELKRDPLGRELHITDIGYYPHASFHYRERNAEEVNEFVLIYCVEGEGWFELDHQRYKITSNQFFILPKHQAHAYGSNATNPWTIYWIHFDGDKAAFFSVGFDRPRNITPEAHSRIKERLTLFEEIYSSISSGYNKNYMLYATTSLFHFLGSMKFIGEYRDCGSMNNSRKDVVQLAIHYMKENLYKSSPLRYLNYLRIQEACHYLDFTDMKISQISPLVGYEDSLYFSRLFTKTMGIPPSEYKAKKKG